VNEFMVRHVRQNVIEHGCLYLNSRCPKASTLSMPPLLTRDEPFAHCLPETTATTSVPPPSPTPYPGTLILTSIFNMTLTYCRCGTHDPPLEGRWTPPCVGVSSFLFPRTPYLKISLVGIAGMLTAVVSCRSLTSVLFCS